MARAVGRNDLVATRQVVACGLYCHGQRGGVARKLVRVDQAGYDFVDLRRGGGGPMNGNGHGKQVCE